MKPTAAINNLSYVIAIFVFVSSFQPKMMQAQTCNPNGNLIIFSNYDGGELNINVDVDIPDLKIGICTYEPVKVNISGPFASSVSEVIYAGFNSAQNNNNCNIGNFPTSISGVPASISSIFTIPAVTVTNPNGYNFGIIGAYTCNTNTDQGGANTIDQVLAYFNTNLGGTLYSLNVQYCCWLNSNVYNVSALAGSCCESDNQAIGISYSAISYCNTDAQTQLPTIIGSTIGSFSAIPIGLSINPITGTINPSLSEVGDYIVNYNVPGCNNISTSASVSITDCSNPNICHPDGNVMIYSNYDGGVLNINVDQNIPNLKIGITSYSATQVSITGPFVGNVTGVIYAGYNSLNNSDCGGNIATTTISGVPADIVQIFSTTTGNTAIANYLGDPIDPGNIPLVNCIVGTSGCFDNNDNGGNSSAQLVQFFLNLFSPTAILYGHFTQHDCFGTYNLSDGGNCCLETPNNPINPIFAEGGGYNFSAAETLSLCGGDIFLDFSNYPVFLQPPTNQGYVWSNGVTGPQITITEPGVYSFTVGDYCHYGDDLLTDTIVVTACCTQPQAPITQALLTYCEGDPIQALSATPLANGLIQWYTSASLNSPIATGNALNISPTVGNNVYYVTETANDCQSEPTVVSVLVNANTDPSFNYANNQYCDTEANPTPIVTGNLGGIFTANPSGLIFANSIGQIDLAASQAGTYIITYDLSSFSNCGQTSSTQTITISSSSAASFSYANDTFCSGLNLQITPEITGNNNGIFTVAPLGLDLQSASNGTLIISNSEPGDYIVTYSIPSIGACPSSSSTFPITILASPTVSVSPLNVISETASIDITASGTGSSYLWSTGAQTNTISVGPQTATYCVTSTLNGCTASACSQVTQNLCFDVFVPNTFSPNFDGRNDYLEVLTDCFFESFQIQIFDRWGNEIFESTNPSMGWDGTYRGEPSPNGVYGYILKYKLLGLASETVAGDITLLR